MVLCVCAAAAQFRRGVLKIYALAAKTEINASYDKMLRAVNGGEDGEILMADVIRMIQEDTESPRPASPINTGGPKMISVEEALANEVCTRWEVRGGEGRRGQARGQGLRE